MSRHLLRLSVSLAAVWPAVHAAPRAPAPLAISFAEQPARLVRATALYRAGRGVALQPRDMLESGSSGIVLDAGGATLAMGPGARIYVASGSELVLLGGWLKLQCRGAQAVTVATPVLQLECAGAALSMRVQDAATELFAESGEVPVVELAAGKRGRPVKVAHEQYAVRSGSQALRLAGRPPAAFVAAMPRSFRDDLVALPGGPVSAPRHERAATWAELAPWLAGQPALRRQLQRRFDPPGRARSAPAQLPVNQQKAWQ